MADAVDELQENAKLSLSRFLGNCRMLARCWNGDLMPHSKALCKSHAGTTLSQDAVLMTL